MRDAMPGRLSFDRVADGEPGEIGEREAGYPRAAVVQVVGGHDVAPGEECGALERVLELAHVAGPGARLEGAAGLGREPQRPPGREALEEVIGEQVDVRRTLADR